MNFPASPALNDIYSFSGKSWQWNGVFWASISVEENDDDVFVGDTAPDPAEFLLWWDTVNRKLFVYHDDGISPEWVVASPGGATGGGTDQVFYENDATVTTSYTIPAGRNAMSTGPITIEDGVTITINDGSRWVVV